MTGSDDDDDPNKKLIIILCQPQWWWWSYLIFNCLLVFLLSLSSSISIKTFGLFCCCLRFFILFCFVCLMFWLPIKTEQNKKQSYHFWGQVSLFHYVWCDDVIFSHFFSIFNSKMLPVSFSLRKTLSIFIDDDGYYNCVESWKIFNPNPI